MITHIEPDILECEVKWALESITTNKASGGDEIPDVQSGFRKGRGSRDKIANICWIMKKAKGFQDTSTSLLLIMPKPLTVWITKNYENSSRDENTRPSDLPPEKPVCRSRINC